ncbi:hypothetical protein, partial [Longimicrobium sp.]|uniref:hypothetical protein n=1 Tax=Longimicrobium sp. TaxID=2029185 RepID=UPI002E336226
MNNIHSAGDGEPAATIFGPEWLRARDRLACVEPEEARALLTAAMDQVESGWEPVRALQRLADRHPEAERSGD